VGEYANLQYLTAKLIGPAMKKTGIYKMRYIAIQGTLHCHLVINSSSWRIISGIFNQIEAARAYDKAAIKFQG